MAANASIPKPPNAGPGQTVIANTRLAYVNIRTGPGTQYSDIGDLRDNTLCVYFPGSRTTDNWFWVESRTADGWVSGDVVTFEPVVGEPPPDHTPTPYDGAVAVWHWKGTSVPESTPEELAANLKRAAPNVNQLWVKTSDGIYWQGRFDSGSMAVNGPSDLTRWGTALAAHGIELHAWCVPQGLDIERETAVIAEACNHPAVKSMILDVEPYAGFWQGGREAVRPFMVQLRQRVSNLRFHIGMSMDPRPWHYASIFPDEWFPFIESLHPQCYWATFRRSPEETLQMMIDTWGSYGRPIYAALQGDAPLIEQLEAHTLATQRYGNLGLSWWRYGVISQYAAVNTPITIGQPPEPEPGPGDYFSDEIIITPESDSFFSGTYTGRDEFNTFEGTWGWKVLYKSTEVRISTVWAEWRTTLPESGQYEIATFVPARNATTQRARFKIHGIRGTTTEVIVEIDQSRNRNRWVALGVFDLVKGQPNAGRVFLNDVTREPDKLIAFDAIRFRRIITLPGGMPPIEPGDSTGPDIINGVYVVDGFDSPIGTAEERRSVRVWPQGWRDASPFAKIYLAGTPNQAYHTGADLNFGSPFEDRGMPVYAPASGIVIYQADLRPWGNVTIIRHDPFRKPDGRVFYTRYGHMQNVRVQVGDRVKRGEQIGEIGDGGGRFIPHLHFDIVGTTVLELKPGDWPGMDLPRLLKHYIDPLQFIQANRP